MKEACWWSSDINFDGELLIGFIGESYLLSILCWADGKFFFDALLPYCFALSMLSLRERFYLFCFSFDIEFLVQALAWTYAIVDLRISGSAGTFYTLTWGFSVLFDFFISRPWVGVLRWPRVLRLYPWEFTRFDKTLPLLILQSGSYTSEIDYSRVDSWITEGMIWGCINAGICYCWISDLSGDVPSVIKIHSPEGSWLPAIRIKPRWIALAMVELPRSGLIELLIKLYFEVSKFWSANEDVFPIF